MSDFTQGVDLNWVGCGQMKQRSKWSFQAKRSAWVEGTSIPLRRGELIVRKIRK